MTLAQLPLRRALLTALALAAITSSVDSAAQAPPAITTDNTVGTAVSLLGTTYTVTGGTVNGSNLFHSFGRFNVPTSGTAAFSGPAATTNVISRVTGGEVSSIDGRINTRTAMPSANFFLINPAGVTFGPNASLVDVGGSFRVATADYIKLADGSVFSAVPVSGEVLTSAAPHAFGFLGNSPAGISVNGPLQAASGKTISLVGGDVQVNAAGRVLATGSLGLVQIASAASPGEAVLAAQDLGFASFERQGAVNISGGAIVRAAQGGTVLIRGGTLIVDQATVSVQTTTAAGPAIGLNLRANDSLVVRNGAVVESAVLGAGNGSGIGITTGSLSVTDGARIEAVSLFAAGNGGGVGIAAQSVNIVNGKILTVSQRSRAGDISIAASGTVTVAGATGEISTVKLNANLGPTLLAGNISLNVGDLILREQGKIQSGGVTGQQAGESVNITAANTVSISSRAGISSQAFSRPAGAINISAPQVNLDAGFILTNTFGSSAGGMVVVGAQTVSLANGAQIVSSSQLGTTGAAGSITINASDSVMINGRAADAGVGGITFSGSPSSGLFSTAKGSGNAGQITVSTPTLTLADAARISVATQATGNAGTILVNAGNLNITGGARFDSSTSGAGAGGAISFTSTGGVSITGVDSGLFSTASSTGGAGQIAVTAPALSIADGGRISVVAAAAGNAGNVVANVDHMMISGGGRIDSSTTGAGAGGAINVSAAGRVEISSGGSVRSDSAGSGLTGNITIAAGDAIVMADGSVSTSALTSDGGNIVLTAPNMITLDNSQITTSVASGAGGGGNIFIDPKFVILKGSSITANAFGGPGGNITIVADNFLTDATSSVTASSALSTPGTVQIQSPDNNVAGDIAQLPRELVDASRLMQGSCAARRAGAPSSFTVAGRGGVPVDPDGYLPSFSASGAPLAGPPSAALPPALALAMASLDCWR